MNLLRCNRGSVVVGFTLVFSILVLSVAGAIELSRWWSARSRVMAAVNGAVLAGARALQMAPGHIDVAIGAARGYYRDNIDGLDLTDDKISFRTSENDTAMLAEGTATLDTPLLSVIGVARLSVVAASAAPLAMAKLAAGSNSTSDIEVALALDITATMAGEKLGDLKKGVKDLIDIVVWDDQSGHTSRVALVPYSDAIRIEDRNWASQIAIPAPLYMRFTDRSGVRRMWSRDLGCVTERTGAAAFTDDPPTGIDRLGVYFDDDGTCMPTESAVLPLTSDKVRLKQAVDSYVAGGETAGHLGIAWAWYLLSPRWSSVLAPASEPNAYEMLHERADNGASRLRKIAVLMTDGDFNTAYCRGVSDQSINCDAANGRSDAQVRALCSNMKTAGIEIFSIGFDLPDGSDAASTLQACASEPSTFFQAKDGEALRQAFKDIAMRISRIFVAF